MVPKTLVPTVSELLNSASQDGHPWKDRCLHPARLEYHWPIMRKDISAYTDMYHTCVINKGSVDKPVHILSYSTPLEPWDNLAIDLLKLSMTSEGSHQYLIVAIHHFSRYSILIPLKNKTAQTVATALIDEVFCKFNTPPRSYSRTMAQNLTTVFSQKFATSSTSEKNKYSGVSPSLQRYGGTPE